MARVRGRVKWFNTQKGFGFITMENGKDVYVDQTGIKAGGSGFLEENQVVEFDLLKGRKGDYARNVVVLS